MAPRFEFFRNLTTGAFSIRRGGKVIARSDHVVLLGDVRLVVQPSGQERALKDQQRNVHAFVTGAEKPQKNSKVLVQGVQELIDSLPYPHVQKPEIFKISYNPFDERKTGFIDIATGQAIPPDRIFDWALGFKTARGVDVYVGAGDLPEILRSSLK